MTEIVPLNNDKKETKSLFKTALATILEDVQLDISSQKSSQTKVMKRIATVKSKGSVQTTNHGLCRGNSIRNTGTIYK